MPPACRRFRSFHPRNHSTSIHSITVAQPSIHTTVVFAPSLRVTARTMGRNLNRTLTFPFLLALVASLLPHLISAQCTAEPEPDAGNKSLALKYKLAAIASILAAGLLGILLPIFSGKFPGLNPGSNLFFLIKAFAAGVILATGFVHILPDAYESLTSPCIGEEAPWGDFPITGFIAMVAAIVTMMIDAFASGYFGRAHFNGKSPPVSGRNDTEKALVDSGDHGGQLHVHTHATHGHAHGSAVAPVADDFGKSDDIRHKIVSQVLELGILVHSVIIGLSLGTSQSLDTIKPLLAALNFHQFFEGIGLGGCISQASFKWRATAVMVIFFSLTTPMGIAVGIGVLETYNENSPTALMVSGILNSSAAGILIYMALVDLIAADFMNPRIQSNLKMQLATSLSLLLGAGGMSLLAKWA